MIARGDLLIKTEEHAVTGSLHDVTSYCLFPRGAAYDIPKEREAVSFASLLSHHNPDFNPNENTSRHGSGVLKIERAGSGEGTYTIEAASL